MTGGQRTVFGEWLSWDEGKEKEEESRKEVGGVQGQRGGDSVPVQRVREEESGEGPLGPAWELEGVANAV